jgi:tripartite-type tricarboxylate transporter receptor subunit TctC
MHNMLRKAVVALSLLGTSLPGLAQEFPAKPVRLIVGFPPGGAVDVIGRIFSNKLSALWNQPVIVDNRSGAAGNIGSELAAKAAPDGYTLIIVASSHVSNGALYSGLPYDPITSFSPISQVTYYSLVLVAHPSVPVSSLADVVAFAKKNPGKLIFNSAGSGAPSHLTAELFRIAVGVDVLHVPYKGSAAATADLLSGQVHLSFSNPVVAIPQVKAGRLRPLVTTGTQRSPLLADIPTVVEAGHPGLVSGTWHAFLGPRGMSREIANKIAADLRAVLQMPDVRERLAAAGVEGIGTTPEQLTRIMHADLEKWAGVIRSANLKPD